MGLLTRFRAEVPLRISPHAKEPFDAAIHDHSAERSVVRVAPTARRTRAAPAAGRLGGPGWLPRPGGSAGPGGDLTRPVSTADPICVVDPASVECCGNPSCPDRPRKPDPPR